MSTKTKVTKINELMNSIKDDGKTSVIHLNNLEEQIARFEGVIEFTNVISGKVILGKHVIIGAGTIILPNVEIEDYSAIGSLSLVNKNISESKIAVGIPAKEIKDRKKNIINLECEYLKKF